MIKKIKTLEKNVLPNKRRTNKICNTSPIIITEFWENGRPYWRIEPNPNYKPL